MSGRLGVALALLVALLIAGGASTPRADAGGGQQASVTVVRSFGIEAWPSETVVDRVQTVQKTWYASIYNSGPGVLHDATIGLDRTDQVFVPPLTTPLLENVGDIAVGSSGSFDELYSRSVATQAATGFDVSRTLAPRAVLPGGGTVHVTVSVTPRQGRDNLYIFLSPNVGGEAPGATLVPGSVSWPLLAAGDASPWTQASDTFVNWSLPTPTIDHEYLLAFDVHVANPSAFEQTYKPTTYVSATSFVTLADDDGRSTTIPDPVVGGTFGFAVTETTHWYRVLEDQASVWFRAIAPAQWAIDVAPDEVTTTPGGGSMQLQVTGHLAPGVKGPLNLFVVDGPPGIEFWGPQVGDGQTVTAALTVTADVPPGDYRVTVGAWVDGVPGWATADIVVHVIPPRPVAYAAVTRFRSVDLPGWLDVVTPWAAMPGRTTWGTGFVAAETDLHKVALTVDRSNRWFVPPLRFPLSHTADVLPPKSPLRLPELAGAPGGSSALDPAVVTGYAVTRSMTPRLIGPGGGTQTVTVAVTPTAARLAGGTVWVQVHTDPDIPAVVVPGSVKSEVWTNADDDNVWLSAPNAAVGKTYSLTFRVSVPNDGGAALVYKPEVTAEVGADEISTADGTATSIADPALGGTFWFQAREDVHWKKTFGTCVDATLGAVAATTAPVTSFRISVPRVIATGRNVVVRLTAVGSGGAPVASYRGPVQLTEQTGTAVFGPVGWSNGVGTVTMTPKVPGWTTVKVTDVSLGGSHASSKSDPFRVLPAP